MQLKATKNLILDGIYYDKGDDIEIKDKATLIRLNEKGFIEPLTPKQVQNFSKFNKEENKDGNR